MLQSYVVVVMVITMMMVDMTGTTTESLQIHGSPQLGYYVQLGLGTPYQVYSFLVDTGSSNLVIAGVKQTDLLLTFDPSRSSTFIDSNKRVNIEYSQGGFTGYLGSDRLWFISFYLSDVSVAIIEESWNFFGTDPQWQGILGLAFDSLMKPSPEETQSVFALLRQQHNDIADIFTLRLCPPLDIFGESNLPRESNMVLGGVDTDDYYGDIYYTPIVKQQYYNILFSNISVNGIMIPLECSQLNRDVTIVDSGTSEVFLNDDVFGAIVKLLKEYFMRRDDLSPPEEFWTRNEQLAWPTKHTDIYDVFPVITFYFPLHDNASMQFGVAMPPQLYLRKVETVERVTGSNVSCDDGECDLFVFSIRSKPSGSLLGNNLMNGYNVVFDRQNMRLGFAVTSCEFRDNTELHDQPKIIDPQPRDNSADCSYHRDKPPETSVYVIVIVTSLAVAFIILILVSLLYLLYCRHGKKSTSFVELDQLNNENDHYDNTVNEPTVQPAQEAGSYSDQLQVGLATPTESSQSHCSKSTTEESLKYMEQHYSIPWTVAGKQKSSLVGLRSNLFETVT